MTNQPDARGDPLLQHGLTSLACLGGERSRRSLRLPGRLLSDLADFRHGIRCPAAEVVGNGGREIRASRHDSLLCGWSTSRDANKFPGYSLIKEEPATGT